jgi:hypothetical protein
LPSLEPEKYWQSEIKASNFSSVEKFTWADWMHHKGKKNRFSIFFPITSEFMGHVHLESGYVRIRPMRQVATLMGTAAEAFTAKTQIDLGV